jgi:hypothetical protein
LARSPGCAESSFKTGFRCIIFCDYGNNELWGGDGGSNCD